MIPRYPGYFSAWGMLATEPRADFVLTSLSRDEDTTIERVREIFAGLEQEARDYFKDEALTEDSITFDRQIDLRYLGQEHTVTVSLDPGQTDIASILNGFHTEHERAYTFKLDDTPVEFVTFRLQAPARVPRPKLTPIGGDGRSAEAAAKGTRRANFGEDGWHEAAVYERDLLPPEFTTPGPLIVEEPSCNTLVHPGQRLRVDELGFLRIAEG